MAEKCNNIKYYDYFCSHNINVERFETMILDKAMLQEFYASYANKVSVVRKAVGHPLTYAEKVLYAHLYAKTDLRAYQRGVDYVDFRPDRVAMQDATAQMALLQFMNAGKSRVAVPASVHCDHLILANQGTDTDLPVAMQQNKEVYDFLRSASAKYGIGFWAPGAGIIHQVVLENYAFPGGMMVGTDSHTPNAGGLGMVAVGVGGADAVDVLTGQPWELRMPRLIGVHLTGQLSGWAAPKDVILKILGMLTVKGGTNAILEYFGEGAESLSTTGKATICNMGAELGATCSLFPFDNHAADYLRQTGRAKLAEAAQRCSDDLRADAEVLANPEQYFDQLIDINLSEIEPYLNGPFTPDAATPISEMRTKGPKEDYPMTVEVALVGSCTNSSYQDLSCAASIARQAVRLHIRPKAQLIVCPGSEQIRYTAERDGLLDDLKQIGAIIMTNACGPCIGQWKRHTDDNTRKNAIVTSFNRNFRRRADGNPNTYAFIGSPEMVVALALSGRLDFNPMTDTLTNADGAEVRLQAPEGSVFPAKGFSCGGDKPSLEELEAKGLFIPPSDKHEDIEVVINPTSERLQRLEPFAPWDGKEYDNMPLLIKVKGKCTTDHISMAGPWLRYRGHLENISANLLMGAVNAFNDKSNAVKDQLDGQYKEVSAAARDYKQHGLGSIVVAEDNYGEGSSREHAAMEPRFLNVKVILAKSFARIHETNLKKQGMLALTFANKNDYDKVREDDRISVEGIKEMKPGSKMQVMLHHADGTTDRFEANHTYNETQIAWLKAGSALNMINNNLKSSVMEEDKTKATATTVTIPFIEGDGVGAEITPVMRQVVDAAVKKAYNGSRKIEWLEVLAGGKAHDNTGEWLPEATIDAFRNYKIGIKGPLMTPVGGGIRSLNVALRQMLDLYVCQRPVRYFKGIVSPVKHPELVDMVVFRENTEDIYAGIEWEAGSPEAKRFYEFLHDEMKVTKVRFPETSGFGVKPVSKQGSERLIDAAIKFALKHHRPTVTLVHKGNIMKFTEGGFKKWGYELAERDYKDALTSGELTVNDCICDAFLQNALLKPQNYSVIATMNLNGDYISDMLAAQVGGIGIAPGANINYQTGHAIFEATHGIAPDIAGKDIVNPSSILLSAEMMLDYLGWGEAGQLIVDALEQLFQQGIATADLARMMPNGKAVGTKEFGDRIINIINA